MPFSIKKSYIGKIRKDQQKFIVKESEDSEGVVTKNVVDGSAEAIKNNTMSGTPATKVAGSKMRKTIYTYADR